jgi:hypothetical protein
VSALGFLLIVVVIVAVPSAYVAMRGRRPRSVETGIEDFHREMQALAPRPGAVRRERLTRPATVDDEDGDA